VSVRRGGGQHGVAVWNVTIATADSDKDRTIVVIDRRFPPGSRSVWHERRHTSASDAENEQRAWHE
jgi:hypothetical protein